MKERGILFSGPMVRALLDGTKTQTRRICKPQPIEDRMMAGGAYWHHRLGDVGVEALIPEVMPYGVVGDRLWVRESWKAHTTFDHLPPRDIPRSHVWYMADDGYKAESRFRQGMFMPRWASRITLEVTEVRVERLQDISEADARAEGITDGGCLSCGNPEPCGCIAAQPDARDSYCSLWESINGAGSWALNPWVWVVEFRAATEPPAALLEDKS